MCGMPAPAGESPGATPRRAVSGIIEEVHILIAGIPATGKSTFSHWLVQHHEYVRCPTGVEPGPRFLAEIVHARAQDPNVVIDWGFPVAALPTVTDLISDGVQPWWFDGDRDAALQCFLDRPGHPATRSDWDRQLAGIEERWEEIESLFRDRILHVISAGPHHVGPEELWATISAQS